MKPDLENYLVGCGYQRQDAVEMIMSFFKGGIKQVEKDFADWNDSEHDYTGEMADNIRMYLEGKWEVAFQQKFLDEEPKESP